MQIEPLSRDAVESALKGLDGWTFDGGAIRRTYDAEDFPAAIHVVNVVAVLAEQAKHHPDIDIRWRTLTFALSTHDVGGRVTARDLDMAAQIDAAIATNPPAR
ncbi:MAG TPA: 4a-hydroxytetrahydrobiopterin dehydratase [Actinocrinis sp.]|uniref:4a-hydroxytetrahydrobiopterin dehydratase n=1 Tax=Actinocrinis sp. TaxID=1920516 RepID=UPI002DDCD669|nr:4a-hydroxytetrahydrobiopterin dehydratase [Actinocrinis sp.]HEV3169165.1 4a-hydroxytetrahydrobiopterin dehydratase [Actinocrinis sp.]